MLSTNLSLRFPFLNLDSLYKPKLNIDSIIVTPLLNPTRKCTLTLWLESKLTQEERYQISVLKSAEHTPAEISRTFSHHKSTVSRERTRSKGLKESCLKQALELALSQRQKKQKPILLRTGKAFNHTYGHFSGFSFSHNYLLIMGTNKNICLEIS